MKKLIIATALLLASGITAFSLSKKENNTNNTNTRLKTESAGFASKPMHDRPKSDLGSAD